MKRWIAGCLLLLAWPLVGWSQQVVRTMPIVLQLDVDAHGQVSHVTPMPSPELQMQGRTGMVVVRKPTPALSGELAKAAGQIAMHWRFSARKVDGKPVSGRTWARARLEIVRQTATTYGVRLKYLSNGPYIYSTVVPRYPISMRVHHHYAGLVLEAVIEPDNSISDIKVVKELGDVVGLRARDFRTAAIKSMQGWKGHAEQIDGHAVATRIRIPIMFALEGVSPTQVDRIHRELEKAVQPRGTPPRAPGAPISGQMLALDSPFVKQPSS
jgi:hypothetical protein